MAIQNLNNAQNQGRTKALKAENKKQWVSFRKTNNMSEEYPALARFLKYV